MKILHGRPPNYKQIVAVFPDAAREGVIFTYGDTIFNSGRTPLVRELLVHEEVHHQQQGDAKETIEAWWARYLVDVPFRFEQELQAHRAEYRAYRARRNGPSRAGLLHITAQRLSSPLYGSIVDYRQAVDMIKEQG